MSLDDEHPTEYFGPDNVTFRGPHGTPLTVSRAEWERLLACGAVQLSHRIIQSTDRELHAYLAADTINLPPAPPPVEVPRQPPVTTLWNDPADVYPDHFRPIIEEAIRLRVLARDQELSDWFDALLSTPEGLALAKERITHAEGRALVQDILDRKAAQ